MGTGGSPAQSPARAPAGVPAATCVSALVVNTDTSAVSILLPAISEDRARAARAGVVALRPPGPALPHRGAGEPEQPGRQRPAPGRPCGDAALRPCWTCRGSIGGKAGAVHHSSAPRPRRGPLATTTPP
ncbi:hypothetical protein EH183_39000 [Streptomyces sp. CB01881]|nr:hypothetical protein C2142_39010 [Streptomyces sp. CB01881]TYC68834.1 hypothetical protein EH183_39000 [Streptomyces sp. CB01881]